MSIEAMKQALEALEDIKDDCSGCEFEWSNDYPLQAKASEVLRQAIAEAEKQEPVAWVHAGSFDAMIEAGAGYCHIYPSKQIGASKPLYTHPQPAQPKREWVGLTFAEICECEDEYLHTFARKIEAKLKEKNK